MSSQLEFKTSEVTAPKPYGPYSHAAIAGDFVFLAGQSGRDLSTGKVIDGDIKAQTVQAIRVIDQILRDLGLNLRHIIRITAFLKDMKHFAEFNEAYQSMFSQPYPVRSTVEAGLPFGALVALEVTAYRKSS